MGLTPGTVEEYYKADKAKIIGRTATIMLAN